MLILTEVHRTRAHHQSLHGRGLVDPISFQAFITPNSRFRPPSYLKQQMPLSRRPPVCSALCALLYNPAWARLASTSHRQAQCSTLQTVCTHCSSTKRDSHITLILRERVKPSGRVTPGGWASHKIELLEATTLILLTETAADPSLTEKWGLSGRPVIRMQQRHINDCLRS